MELIINPEFQNLIPPLSSEELSLLEVSLKHEGCRDPLVVWNNTIIDGHHRYAICIKHNISFNVIEKTELETELDVEEWMIRNQIGRRNLTTIQKAEIALKLEAVERKKAKARQGTRNDLKNDNIRLELAEGEESGKALEKAAKAVGLSYETVRKTKQILEKAPEEVKQELKQGKVSIDRAYNKIQKAERLEKNRATEWPKGKYRVIYADPPWQYGDERSGGNHGGAVDPYNTMGINELKNMPIASLAEDNAVLFLWATAPLLPEALELINAWGFKYKTNFIWDKVKHNMGHYNSVRHELLLIATKGSCTPDNVQLFDSVQSIERTDRHSEKPEEFRKIIETLYTFGNKLEMFARKSVEGWEVFGNEL